MKKEDLKKYLMLETPVVVYNLDDLSERLCTLNNILPDWINVIYSVKANSNKKILDLFSKNKLIKGFEVSSYQELHKIEKFSEKKSL
ncbi:MULTISPECIES: hypothetical protein [Staphylococcus]|uniref:hypothetical protein n=2 Tax=Staphylococcus TaxID=1279 RepID=UPI00092C62CB|nr:MULTISPECIES: hypothetical protein [Staphylococcus]RNM25135.1 hypothetical protein EFY80_10870 [Staphylococcus cohnii]MBL0384812.1 hypothetical protein [Staphylococcus sp. S59]MDU9372293.1 hypothetical protein [Staphylococcus ureilyticus]OJT32826.1 hypothetical protein BSF33_10910 [Staphylococcus ureilyticus]RXZ26064.1 hypothetical protein ESM34_12265 [Staphylococcus sp. SNAZ 59]